ncbi:MAG: hypothetical protein HC927_08050 [Deltaproteobacteria bacterium]|nr:hypothetical protein [Deltaproteobacteria bacterium]
MCGKTRNEIAGSWSIGERIDPRTSKRWQLSLRPSGLCSLVGTASSGSEQRSVVVELTKHGGWLVRDPSDPSFAWALVGQDFVFGEGSNSSQLRGQKNPSSGPTNGVYSPF